MSLMPNSDRTPQSTAPSSSNSPQAVGTTATPAFEINASRQFTSWLASQNLSLVFTTYQAGKVFFIGLRQNGELSVFERTFERCMGLYAHNSSLYMSSLYQLWRLENALEPGQIADGYDAVYVPQVGYITGDLDIHDVVLVEPPQPPKLRGDQQVEPQFPSLNKGEVRGRSLRQYPI
jgi:hypothetical protein